MEGVDGACLLAPDRGTSVQHQRTLVLGDCWLSVLELHPRPLPFVGGNYTRDDHLRSKDSFEIQHNKLRRQVGTINMKSLKLCLFIYFGPNATQHVLKMQC